MNRISTSMTIFLPLMFAGSLVTAQYAAADPPAGDGVAVLAAPAEFEGIGTTDGSPGPDLVGSATPRQEFGRPEGSRPVDETGSISSLPWSGALTTEVARKNGTGSASSIPGVLRELMQLFELVKQIPLPTR